MLPATGNIAISWITLPSQLYQMNKLSGWEWKIHSEYKGKEWKNQKTISIGCFFLPKFANSGTLMCSVHSNRPVVTRSSTEAASEQAECSSADASFQSADASGSAPTEARAEAEAEAAPAGPSGENGGPSRRSSRVPAGPAAKTGDDSDAESTTGLEEGEFLVEKILDYVREKVSVAQTEVRLALVDWSLSRCSWHDGQTIASV